MLRRLLPLALFAALACQKPPVGPALDDKNDAYGVIQGSLIYSGTARGDAILLLFDTTSLPPPDGNGTSAVEVSRIPASSLFGNAAAASIGPFSAPYIFTQVPAGRSYQVRAFLDVKGEFDPFFDFTQQPRAGSPAGGYGGLVNGRPALLPIPVVNGQVTSNANVALTQVVPYDPPSFELAGGSRVIDVSIDQPVLLRLQTTQLASKSASFAHARFGVELDLDANGQRQSTAGDGLDDVFPRVILRQIKNADGSAPADPAIVPCRAIGIPVLPALLASSPGQAPAARETLDVLVEPLALKSSNLSALPKIPAGVYQTVVIEKSGQVWTVPNELGNPAMGSAYYAASQAQTVTFDSHLPPQPGAISGNVVFHGDPAVKSGNIVVQAYLASPYAPPPPLGAARPVRVQIIRAQDVTRTSDGFTAPYRISGLPAGNYVVQALSDVDGNFSGLNLLQTPTRGDLVGAVFDSTLQPAVIPVAGEVTGQQVTLAVQVPLDPPAFAIDPSTPAQMPADQVTTVRFDLRAQAPGFPAGAVNAPHFAVQLVRDSGGAPVDADQDGLPDVWPRVFLVRLDSSDPAGLTQFVSADAHQTVTQVIPAAIDPTPFITALQPQNPAGAAPVLTDKITVVVRPALLDATDPTQPPRRLPSLQPGAYKIVVVAQTGQVWQIPNEAGSAALDPSVVCTTATCAPGTVKTQSQSQAFQVGPPAHAIFSGGIAGTLQSSATPVNAYVFAYAANALPPFGRPLSADVHSGAEFVTGSVPYHLPDLPTGDYVVVAVADTRGDFSPSSPLLSLAPGAGTLLAGPAAVHVGTDVVAGVTLTAASATPPRPSFQLEDSSGALQTGDLPLSLAGARKFKVAPAAVLKPGISSFHPDTAIAFVVACGASGPDATSLTVTLLKVRDAAGLVPDADVNGNLIAAPAAVDFTPYAACSPGLVTIASPLDVTAPATLPTGRYAVMLTSIARQVWRVPNELQPALIDPGAYAATAPALKTTLQSQQAAVMITP